MIRTFRNTQNGDVYRIDFRRRWLSGRYEVHCVSHPDCPYPVGVPALLEGDELSVMTGREPKTLAQAKAVALHWLSGFSVYARTGVFPVGPARAGTTGPASERVERPGARHEATRGKTHRVPPHRLPTNPSPGGATPGGSD